MRTRRSQTRNRQQQSQPAVVQPFHLEEPFVNPPLVPMADNRTMAQLLQAPTEGFSPDLARKRTSSINFILTWISWFQNSLINFIPPSKTTNLRNEITRFQQRFDESFYEAWDRFNDLLRACPHHGFSKLHQLDTFYNALNANDQDSLNSAAGGNFLDKMPRECLRIIESKSKMLLLLQPKSLNLRLMKTMIIDKQKAQAPATVKAIEQEFSCNCGGAHSYKNCPATDGNVYRDNIQEYVSQAAATNFNQGNTNSRPPMVSNQIRPPGSLPSNTVTNPKEDLKGITTRSGIAYKGPTILLLKKWNENRVTKTWFFPTNNGITEDVQPSVVPVEKQNPVSEPDVAPVSAPMPNPKPSIPFPSRRNDERYHENANEQKEKFYEIFKIELSKYHTQLIIMKYGESNRLFELACKSYSQEVLGFSNVIAQGNPHSPDYDPNMFQFFSDSQSSDSDFLLLEEADAFLALVDDPTSPEVDESY
ncbi:reverse transcriptase domain-containing protein [Tanacetum coccineum]